MKQLKWHFFNEASRRKPRLWPGYVCLHDGISMPDHILVKIDSTTLLHKIIIVYILGLLSYAHAQFTCPGWAAPVAREKAPNNARAAAIIWDMHVFINQLIECGIYF